MKLSFGGFPLVAGLVIAVITPVLAQVPNTLEITAPSVGDVCTHRMTDQRIGHKGQLVTVMKSTVMQVTPEGIVTARREVLERGPRGTEAVGSVVMMLYTQAGILEMSGVKYVPYIPILGNNQTKTLRPGVTLGAPVDYTFPSSRDGNPVSTSLTGKVTEWRDVEVPAGKFRALEFGWEGVYSHGQNRNMSIEMVRTRAEGVPCDITYTYSAQGRTLEQSVSTLSELVKYEKSSASEGAITESGVRR